MNSGWIKLSRGLPNHWLWMDERLLKWWLDLLIRACWEDRKVYYRGRLIELKRGQQLASVAFLAKRWGCCVAKARSFLNVLEYNGMIERSISKSRPAILTIINYEKYQASGEVLVNKSKEGKKQNQSKNDFNSFNGADY